MIPSFKDFGLYHIDIDYIKYLNFVDPEVRYDDSRNYTKKPFLGYSLWEIRNTLFR